MFFRPSLRQTRKQVAAGAFNINNMYLGNARSREHNPPAITRMQRNVVKRIESAFRRGGGIEVSMVGQGGRTCMRVISERVQERETERKRERETESDLLSEYY